MALLLGACGDDLAPEAGAQMLAEAPSWRPEAEALWRPAALLLRADGELLFAEQASGRVRAWRPDGTLRVVLDTWSGQIGAPAPVWPLHDERFGLGLVEAGADLLLASPGVGVALLDPTGAGAPAWLGAAGGGDAPAVGGRLGDLDLSALAGLAATPSGDLLLALDARIWRARRAPGQPLASARLEHVAGDGQRAAGPALGDARALPLDLGGWVGLAEDDAGGVYFTEGQSRLRYVSPEGRIMVLTGDGPERGEGVSLARFGARLEARNHLVWRPGRLYFLDSDHVLVAEITALDAEAGEATGSIQTAAPYPLRELGGYAIDADGAVWATDAFVGALLWAAPGAEDYEVVYGPPLFDPYVEAARYNQRRYDLTQSEPDRSYHEPYRLQALLLPQSVAALDGGEQLLVSLPLARATVLIDRARGALEEFTYTPEPDTTGHPHLATHPALPDRFGLLRSRELELFTYTATGEVFRFLLRLAAPRPGGVPGPLGDALIVEEAALRAAHGSAQLLLSDALLELDLVAQHVEVLTGPIYGVSPLRERAGLRSLALAGRAAWAIHPTRDCRLFALPDEALGARLAAGCAEGALRLAGHALTEAPDHVPVLGGGQAAPVDGVAAREARLAAIDAVSFSGDTVLFAARAQVEDAARLGYLAPGDEGLALRWLPAPCDAPPLTPTRLLPLALDATAPGEAALVAVWSPEDAQLHACALVEGGRIGDVAVPTGGWVAVGEPTGGVAPDRAGARGDAVLLHDPEGARLLVTPVGDAAAGVVAVETSGLPGALTDAALDDEGAALVALVDDGARRRLLAARLTPLGADDPRAAWAAAPAWTQLLGDGRGVGDGAPVAELKPGQTLGAGVLDAEGDLYLSMLDTGALWRVEVPVVGAPPDDERGYVLAAGPPIYTPGLRTTPMVVDEEGVVIIGAGARVWRVTPDGAVSPLLGGGAQALADGVAADAVALDEVVGLTLVDARLHVLTLTALFALDDDGRVRMLSREGAITLSDGTTRPLGFRTMGQPVLAPGRPGELLMVYPPTHGLVSIPTR